MCSGLPDTRGSFELHAAEPAAAAAGRATPGSAAWAQVRPLLLASDCHCLALPTQKETSSADTAGTAGVAQAERNYQGFNAVTIAVCISGDRHRRRGCCRRAATLPRFRLGTHKISFCGSADAGVGFAAAAQLASWSVFAKRITPIFQFIFVALAGAGVGAAAAAQPAVLPARLAGVPRLRGPLPAGAP